MKVQTTQKYIKTLYPKIVKIGYCDLQHLLHFEDAAYYNAGVYGWNCDIYCFGDIAIVTGYNPFGNIKLDYNKIKEYDNKAYNIICDYNLTYEQQKEQVTDLLNKFLLEV